MHQPSVRGQQPPPHERGHDRDAERRGETRHLVLDAVAPDLHVHEDHRPLRRTQMVQHLARGLRERLRVGRARRQRHDRLARGPDQVARQLDIDGQRVVPRRAQHARDLARRAHRVAEHGLIAGDLLEDAGLRVERAAHVVQPPARRALGNARRARHHDDRHPLRVAARDRVHEIERPRAPGRDRDREAAPEPRCRVRREADGRLVAQRVERQRPALLHDLEERQHEIARDAEDLARPMLAQRIQQGAAERRAHATARAAPGERRPAARDPAAAPLPAAARSAPVAASRAACA